MLGLAGSDGAGKPKQEALDLGGSRLGGHELERASVLDSEALRQQIDLLEEDGGLQAPLLSRLLENRLAGEVRGGQTRHVGEVRQQVEAYDDVIGGDLLYTLLRGCCRSHRSPCVRPHGAF